MDAKQKIEAAERELFERSTLTRHLDKSEGEDAWGRPQYTPTHVDAMYAGWKARAELAAQTLASNAAEVERLREALTEIVETKASEHGTTPMMLFRCMKLAEAALTNQQPTE